MQGVEIQEDSPLRKDDVDVPLIIFYRVEGDRKISRSIDRYKSAKSELLVEIMSKKYLAHGYLLKLFVFSYFHIVS